MSNHFIVHVLQVISKQVEVEAPTSEAARSLVVNHLVEWGGAEKEGTLFQDFLPHDQWPVELKENPELPFKFVVTNESFFERTKEVMEPKGIKVLVCGSEEHKALEAAQEASRTAETIKWWQTRVKDLEAELEAARAKLSAL